MEITGFEHPGRDPLRVKLRIREDPGVGQEVDLRAVPLPRPGFLHSSERLSAPETHFPLPAVPPDSRRQRGTQRVYHRRADAVQPAGGVVGAPVEFPSRVQRGEDHLERRFPRRLVDVHGNPAAVVLHRDRAVAPQRHVNPRRVAVHGLVHAVVEDLPDEVVEPFDIGSPDVHGGALPHRGQPLEDGDVAGGVLPSVAHGGPFSGSGSATSCFTVSKPALFTS